jgi:hypothetical protein
MDSNKLQEKSDLCHVIDFQLSMFTRSLYYEKFRACCTFVKLVNGRWIMYLQKLIYEYILYLRMYEIGSSFNTEIFQGDW